MIALTFAAMASLAAMMMFLPVGEAQRAACTADKNG